eukprot:608665-Pelagomonas_calceolata.AAC.1
MQMRGCEKRIAYPEMTGGILVRRHSQESKRAGVKKAQQPPKCTHCTAATLHLTQGHCTNTT